MTLNLQGLRFYETRSDSTSPIQKESNDMAAQVQHNIATSQYDIFNGKQ